MCSQGPEPGCNAVDADEVLSEVLNAVSTFLENWFTNEAAALGLAQPMLRNGANWDAPVFRWWVLQVSTRQLGAAAAATLTAVIDLHRP